MPTLAGNIQAQDYKFSWTTPQGVWRWITRVDLSGSSPAYWIADVVTPFGRLRDSVPLPGQVVTAMADSIAELMSAFAPAIVLGPSLMFTLDEGRGVSDSQALSVGNGGVFGSLLSVSLTSSASYVTTIPANIGSLAFNSTGSAAVTADSTMLLAMNSPYTAVITVQDASATNSPQAVGITINVRPKATITPTPSTLNFTVAAPLDETPFPPIPSQMFTLNNSGPSGSVLEYEVQKLTGLSDWLVGFSPSYGSLNGGISQPITVVVAPPAIMCPGTYTETLQISGYSTNLIAQVVVTLTIT